MRLQRVINPSLFNKHILPLNTAGFNKGLTLARRWLLKNLVPEIFWPVQVRLDGVSIPLRNTPYSFGTKWILKKGSYEMEERKLLASLLRPGMQVLEMGSSIGIVTAIVADKIGASGKMVAVEASESLVDYSTTWLSRYPQLTVLPGFGFPVAHAPGIRIEGFNEARGNLGGVVSFGPDSGAAGYDSRVWDINRICREFNLEPELLVVDIEGSELVMASNPLDFPQSVKHLLIEFHPGLMPGGHKDVAVIKNALVSEGFSLAASNYHVCLFSR